MDITITLTEAEAGEIMKEARNKQIFFQAESLVWQNIAYKIAVAREERS